MGYRACLYARVILKCVQSGASQRQMHAIYYAHYGGVKHVQNWFKSSYSHVKVHALTTSPHANSKYSEEAIVWMGLGCEDLIVSMRIRRVQSLV